MPRLVDADELMKTIKAHHYLLKTHLNSTDYGMFTFGIQHAVDEQPIVDAVRVVHGKWVEYPRAHYFKCSNCKYTVPHRKANLFNGKREYNYCPHCGAKMDG